MEGELKACPFCGSAVTLETSANPAHDHLRIKCPSSHCYIRPSTLWREEQEQAIRAWNTRALPASAIQPGALTREQIERWRQMLTGPHDCTYPETPCQHCDEDRQLDALCRMALSTLARPESGFTAAQAWDEGFHSGQHDGEDGYFGPNENPYRPKDQADRPESGRGK